MLVSFLMSLHLNQRTIFLTRTGHSGKSLTDRGKVRMPGLENKYCEITESGRAFAKKLAVYVKKRMAEEACPLFEVHSSILPRAVQTAEAFEMPYKKWAILNMFDLGPVFSGLIAFFFSFHSFFFP